MVEGSELRRALVAQMSATASNQDRIESYQILEQFKKINPAQQVKAIGQLSQENDENIKHAAKGIALKIFIWTFKNQINAIASTFIFENI